MELIFVHFVCTMFYLLSCSLAILILNIDDIKTFLIGGFVYLLVYFLFCIKYLKAKK